MSHMCGSVLTFFWGVTKLFFLKVTPTKTKPKSPQDPWEESNQKDLTRMGDWMRFFPSTFWEKTQWKILVLLLSPWLLWSLIHPFFERIVFYGKAFPLNVFSLEQGEEISQKGGHNLAVRFFFAGKNLWLIRFKRTSSQECFRPLLTSWGWGEAMLVPHPWCSSRSEGLTPLVLTSCVQKRFGFPDNGVELYAERVVNRGLSAIAQVCWILSWLALLML